MNMMQKISRRLGLFSIGLLLIASHIADAQHHLRALQRGAEQKPQGCDGHVDSGCFTALRRQQVLQQVRRQKQWCSRPGSVRK